MTWVAPEARTFVSSGVKSACCTSVEMSTTGAFPRSFRKCTNMSWPPLPKALFTQMRAIFSALRSSSIQRTCFAMPVSWVNEVRKLLSLPFWVMMIDSEPVNCGTPAWRAMSMLATVLELYTVPKIAKGLSLSTRRMTATEVGGSVWVSCTDVSSFKPRMPPFLVDVLDGQVDRVAPHRADAGATARDLGDDRELDHALGARRRDGHQSHQRREEWLH